MQDGTRVGSRAKGQRLLAIALILASAGLGMRVWQQNQQAARERAQLVIPPPITAVTALGRLQPVGETIALSPPAASSSSRVEELLVKEGDRVKAGQIVAVMDNRDRLQAALETAQQQVAVARAKLAQIEAGAKSGEIGAQAAKVQQIRVELENDRATQIDEIAKVQAQWEGERAVQSAAIARLEAALENAQSERDRYQQLYLRGAISTSVRDSKQLAADTARQQLAEARAALARIDRTSSQQLSQAQTKLQRLNASGEQQIAAARSTLAQVREVRPTDVQAAAVEVDRAMAAVREAKANLETAVVTAPQDGEVLAIRTHPGEIATNAGIVEIGQTERMEAVAEVYQSDIAAVRLGHKARISSEVLEGDLVGTVSYIGSQIQRQTIVNTDPSSNIDARVVEVRVALDAQSNPKAAKFTNLQVRVAIDR